MEDVALSIERPILLSPASRGKLERAQKRLRESVEGGGGGSTGSETDEVLERAYEDESQSTRPELPPLSHRLRKLWSERGDFSRFRASTLAASDSKAGEGEHPEEECQWDLGASLQGLIDLDRNNEAKEEGAVGEADGRQISDVDAVGGKDVMKIEDMVQLRSKMLEKLASSQNAIYFSHALVSLLINSTKAEQGSTSNPSAARAGSPNSTSAGGAGGGLTRGDTAASTSAVQRGPGALNVMGSAASLEAELGIEPHVFGASRLETERREVDPRGGLEEEGGVEEEESEHEDEEEDLQKEMDKRRKEDKKMSESEREEKVRELVDCYQGKQQGLDRAVDILKRGASALRGNEERNKRKEEKRWQMLLQAKRTGWGLTPDKPLRGTANNKRELLEDGNRKRDEPARDAWIGYAIPEANAAYRRRALAYFSHETATPSETSPVQALAFASRPRKALRVRLVVGGETWTSGRVAEEQEGISTDNQLRCAQRQLADAELFDGIVAECRAIASSSLFQTTINDEDGVSIVLNDATLFIEMARTDEGEGEGGEKEGHRSALATAIVALLRLGLVRQYRARAGVSGAREQVARKGKEDGLQMPLLLPILGSLHFASFISKLRAILERVKRADARKEYELHGLEKVQNCQNWLALLLQSSQEWGSSEAMKMLGGSAIVSVDGHPSAFLTISYPSTLSLSLPMKRNSVGGRGVQLSRVDVRALEDILSEQWV